MFSRLQALAGVTSEKLANIKASIVGDEEDDGGEGRDASERLDADAAAAAQPAQDDAWRDDSLRAVDDLGDENAQPREGIEAKAAAEAATLGREHDAAEVLELRETVASLEAQISAIHAQYRGVVGDLQGQNAALQQRVAELDQWRAQLEAGRSADDVRQDSLNRALLEAEQWRKRAAAAEEEAANARQRGEELQLQVERAQAVAAAAQLVDARRRELEATLREREEELLRAKRSLLQVAEADRSAADERIAALESELADKAAAEEVLLQRLGRVQEELQSTTESTAAQLERARDEAAAVAQAELDRRDAELAALASKLQAELDHRRAQEAEAQRLQETLRKLQARLEQQSAQSLATAAAEREAAAQRAAELEAKLREAALREADALARLADVQRALEAAAREKREGAESEPRGARVHADGGEIMPESNASSQHQALEETRRALEVARADADALRRSSDAALAAARERLERVAAEQRRSSVEREAALVQPLVELAAANADVLGDEAAAALQRAEGRSAGALARGLAMALAQLRQLVAHTSALQEEVQREREARVGLESASAQVLSQAQSQYEALMAQFRKLQSTCHDALRREEEARSRLDAVEKENQRLFSEKRQLEAARQQRHDSESAEVAQLRERVEELEAAVAEREAHAQSLAVDIAQRAQDRQRHEAEMMQQIALLKQQLSESEDECTRLGDALARTDGAAREQLVTREQALAAMQVEVERLQRELELQRSLTQDVAQLREALAARGDEVEQAQSELAHLQLVLESIQTERDRALREAVVAKQEREQAVQRLTTIDVLRREVADARQREEAALEKLGAAQKNALKLEQDNATMRRTLQQVVERLSADENMVDRRLVNKLLVTFVERPEQRDEVLNLMCGILKFTDEEKRRVGFGQHSKRSLTGRLAALASFVLGSSDEAEETAAAADRRAPVRVDFAKQNLADLWVEFLLQESAAGEEAQQRRREEEQRRALEGLAPQLPRPTPASSALSPPLKIGGAMIYAMLVVNNHGQPRLTKFYVDVEPSRKQEIVRECFNLVSKRSDRVCNFLEESKVFGKEVKLVYRHYATLYFICAVDESESELGVLDLIQVFVESLDKFFENVCELDLVYHTDKVHYVLDEIIMGGLVLETNLTEITSAVKGANKHEASTRSQHLRKSSIVASLQRKA